MWINVNPTMTEFEAWLDLPVGSCHGVDIRSTGSRCVFQVVSRVEWTCTDSCTGCHCCVAVADSRGRCKCHEDGGCINCQPWDRKVIEVTLRKVVRERTLRDDLFADVSDDEPDDQVQIESETDED